MTTLRDRARKLREDGEAGRDDYAPEPGSTPVRLYKYWLKNGLSSPPERENFCHYWRVVILWAPLTWVRLQLARAGAPVIIASLYVLFFIFLGLVTSDPLVVSVVAVTVPWFLAGVGAGVMFLDGDRGALLWSVLIVTAPVSLLVVALGRVGKLMTPELLNIIFVVVVSALVVVLLALGVYDFGWMFLVWLALFIGGVFGLAFGAAFLASWLGPILRARRREQENRAAEAEAERELSEDAVSEPREPGPFRKFFTILGDFIILFGQVVRVSKWKICPTVTIPVDDTDENR